MLVNSIDLRKKKFIHPSLKRMRCEGLYPALSEEKDGYAVFDRLSYIDTNDSRDYSRKGSFSVCVWVRKSVSSIGYAVCQTHPFLVYESDWIISGESSLFWMRNRALGEGSLLNDFKWHHLAFVWDMKRERYKGYIDRVLIGESDVVTGYGGTLSVKIGARGDANSSFWVGGIAHVKIFLRTLTDTEVRNIAEMTSITDGLGSYYPLAENALDYSGRGKDGRSRGAVFVRGW